MKSFNIILAADDGYHLDFLPLASAGWRKFFPEFEISLVIAGERSWADYWKYCSPWVDQLEVVRPIEEESIPNQTKIARLWYAGKHNRKTCTIHDIDFTPLQRSFYEEKYSQWAPQHFMAMGKEVYGTDTNEHGKTPMSAMTTESFNWRSLVNPMNLSFEDLFFRYAEPHELTANDMRELTTVSNFSDESLMRPLMKQLAPHCLIEIPRGYHIWTDTLDRAAWKPDRVKLWSEGYYEAHMHKINTQWERDRCNIIAEFLGIEDEWKDGKHWTDLTNQWEDIKRPDPDPCPEMTTV